MINLRKYQSQYSTFYSDKSKARNWNWKKGKNESEDFELCMAQREELRKDFIAKKDFIQNQSLLQPGDLKLIYFQLLINFEVYFIHATEFGYCFAP